MPDELPAPPTIEHADFYTKPPATIARDQTVTLVYSIDGSIPVWELSDINDVPPATMHLFLWRSGDDLSCNGAMASYRFWAPAGVTLSSVTVRR